MIPEARACSVSYIQFASQNSFTGAAMPHPEDEPQFLRHLISHCAGDWRPTRITGVWFWRCAVCRAIHLDDPWVRGAALQEVHLGEQLRDLERDGRRMLGREDA